LNNPYNCPVINFTKPKKKAVRIDHVDLFCGLGGVTKGMMDSLGDNYRNIVACDFDLSAKKTYLKNFPCHRFSDDIKHLTSSPDAELLRLVAEGKTLASGGSPCQGLSRINNAGKGLACKKSILFFEFIKFLRIYRPKYFIFENVGSMSNENERLISKILGCGPIVLQSNWLGAPQLRKRYFWVNWDIDLEKMKLIKNTLKRDGVQVHAWSKSRRPDGSMDERIRVDGIANTIVTSSKSSDSVNFFPPKKKARDLEGFARKVYSKEDLIYKDIKKEWLLTPDECEEAHGLPRGWTEGVSNSQRYKQLGNAISPPVIKYIMDNIKEPIHSVLDMDHFEFLGILNEAFPLNEIQSVIKKKINELISIEKSRMSKEGFAA
jgi:site-specific DNA-cytosine methylase